MLIQDIEPNKYLEALKDRLKKIIKEKPEWIDYVKSGPHKERIIEQEDFWWMKMASILRKLYLFGEIGVERFRKIYGGKKNRGVKPERKVKAGGKIIRAALQTLEKYKLVEKGKKGRRLTAKGMKLLDEVAKEFKKK